MSDLNLVTISFSPPFPESGGVTAIVRLTSKDKYVVDAAAAKIGMRKADFMRVLLVKGAERILQELGVRFEYEVDSPKLWGESD